MFLFKNIRCTLKKNILSLKKLMKYKCMIFGINSKEWIIKKIKVA